MQTVFLDLDIPHSRQGKLSEGSSILAALSLSLSNVKSWLPRKRLPDIWALLIKSPSLNIKAGGGGKSHHDSSEGRGVRGEYGRKKERVHDRERDRMGMKRANVGVYYHDSFIPTINRVVKGSPATFTYFFSSLFISRNSCRLSNLFVLQLFHSLWVCSNIQRCLWCLQHFILPAIWLYLFMIIFIECFFSNQTPLCNMKQPTRTDGTYYENEVMYTVGLKKNRKSKILQCGEGRKHATWI